MLQLWIAVLPQGAAQEGLEPRRPFPFAGFSAAERARNEAGDDCGLPVSTLVEAVARPWHLPLTEAARVSSIRSTLLLSSQLARGGGGLGR